MLVSITLPSGEFQLPSRVRAKVRPLVESGSARFRCGHCQGQVGVSTGYGANPDELLCSMCGRLWFGYVSPSHFQRTPQARRLRKMAEIDDRRSTDQESLYDALRRKPEGWE